MALLNPIFPLPCGMVQNVFDLGSQGERFGRSSVFWGCGGSAQAFRVAHAAHVCSVARGFARHTVRATRSARMRALWFAGSLSVPRALRALRVRAPWLAGSLDTLRVLQAPLVHALSMSTSMQHLYCSHSLPGGPWGNFRWGAIIVTTAATWVHKGSVQLANSSMASRAHRRHRAAAWQGSGQMAMSHSFSCGMATQSANL